MLRPIYLDLLNVAAPLAAASIALVVGRYAHRLPRMFFCVVIGLAVVLVLELGMSYFMPFPERINLALWHVGGEAVIASVLAAFLLGVVLESRGRSTSTGFLRVMVGLVALILVLSTGGRLWWRNFNTSAWENTADANGCLTQTTGWTCSPATATMLLSHYGIETSEGEMAYLANTSYLGTDVYSIAHAMRLREGQGLDAHVALADLESCIQQKEPFLACVKVPGLGGHAVLVRRVYPDCVELVDPRYGKLQTVPREEIEPQWQGKIVRLQKK